MAARRNEIRSKAAAVCRGDQIHYIVIFRRTSGEGARGVGLAAEPASKPTMYVTMLHQDAAVPAAGEYTDRCSVFDRVAQP